MPSKHVDFDWDGCSFPRSAKAVSSPNLFGRARLTLSDISFQTPHYAAVNSASLSANGFAAGAQSAILTGEAYRA